MRSDRANTRNKHGGKRNLCVWILAFTFCVFLNPVWLYIGLRCVTVLPPVTLCFYMENLTLCSENLVFLFGTHCVPILRTLCFYIEIVIFMRIAKKTNTESENCPNKRECRVRAAPFLPRPASGSWVVYTGRLGPGPGSLRKRYLEAGG